MYIVYCLRTENFVAQELTANEHKLHYWERNNAAELDFVIQQEDRIIPLRLKRMLIPKPKALVHFAKNIISKWPFVFLLRTLV